jgi:Protein of unknown function (DUF3224)
LAESPGASYEQEAGKTGSFALQHNGTMDGRSRELAITVTPSEGF